MSSSNKRDAGLALLGAILLVCLVLEPAYWWLYVAIILVAAIFARARDARDGRQQAG